MAYRFELDRSVPAEVRRIAAEELGFAAKRLATHSLEDRDEAIHDARKSLKKTRALLRLVRDRLGMVYAVENTRLRDIGLTLSEHRDAGAMIETFDDLRKHFEATLRPRTLESVRKRLVAIRDQQVMHGSIEPVLRRQAAALRRARLRALGWPLSDDGFSTIEPGLARTYRGGAKAMAAALDDGTDEHWHEWRKRAKTLWYHVRLLEGSWSAETERFERELKKLEQLLGDDHNLSVLRERVTNGPTAFGNGRQTGFLLELAGERQQQLRSEAAALGEGMYLEKTSYFLGRIHGLWEAWRAPLAKGKAAVEPGPIIA